MNWFYWLSLGYWLGGREAQQGNSNTGVGCLAIIIFVLAVEYLLPKWFTLIIVPGLLFEFKPIQTLLTAVMATVCLFICRRIKSVADISFFSLELVTFFMCSYCCLIPDFS